MSDIVERDISPMSAEEVSKLKAAVQKRWDEKPHYPGGGGILSPGCMLRAEEVLGLIARIEQLERENAELKRAIDEARKVIEPFADCAREWDGEDDALHVFFEWDDETPAQSLPVADFRAARTWMEKNR